MSLRAHYKYGSDTSYNDALANELEKSEGNKKLIYADTSGYPTIGIGYAFINKSEIRKGWRKELTDAGITLTTAQEDELKKLLNNIYADRSLSETYIETYYADNLNTLEITSTQGKNLLSTIVISYEKIVKKKLGITIYNKLKNSKEMIALVSMEYNGVGLGSSPSLLTAIKTNNRVKAWYEIRYNSNDNDQPDNQEKGIANRRVDESNIFGLYSSTDGKTPQSDNEAKNVIRFLENHRSNIQTEIDHVRGLSGSNANLNLKADDLDTQLESSKNLLINTYAQGTSIDGNIIVGQGIGDIPEAFADGLGNNSDHLTGTNKNDLILGERGDDTLIGGKGSDVLYGGEGDDTLIGGMAGPAVGDAPDYLDGGKGFDTYITGKDDTIHDSDGKGKIQFNGVDLTGRKKLNKKTNLYEDKDKDFTYKELNGNLIITAKDGKSITIKEWKNKQLGIELVKNDDIEISITESNSANEGNSGTQSMSFTLTLSRALEDGESLKVAVSNTKKGTYTFSSGESSKTFTHTWKGDTVDEGSIDHTATLTPTVVEYKGESQDVKVTVKNSGKATVYDDDDDNRYDPLVLDTNKDGFISTTSLENSNTYFDLTGDGLKERVGWIKPEDGLLVYDKNGNGQIDGIDEVFGNLNKSGFHRNFASQPLFASFEELKELIDSNHDNKIDRKDELYNQLQVWNDLNGDAKVQKGELRTLSQADIKSIDLNIVETNIEINGNLLTEASKYTDSKGNKELVADVQLATDVKDTKVDIADIPDFTIDESTRENSYNINLNNQLHIKLKDVA